MVFDTTALNTGQVTAACVLSATGFGTTGQHIQHYIGEVIIAQIFTGLLKIEASKSTEVSMFSRFRKHFESLLYIHKESLTFLDSSYFNETKVLVQEWAS